MFSTAEVEARAPPINDLKNYFPGIDESTPTPELVRKTQLIGTGSDPLLARSIRRLEDADQNAREGSGQVTESNEAQDTNEWFVRNCQPP
jgi:hypothetical protein